MVRDSGAGMQEIRIKPSGLSSTRALKEAAWSASKSPKRSITPGRVPTRKALWVLALLWQASPILAAEEKSAESAPAASPRVGQTHELPRASGEITVNGSLDDAAWSDALVLSLRYETRPGENIDPPVETQVLATYDDSAVYFAFLLAIRGLRRFAHIYRTVTRPLTTTLSA